MINSLTSLRIVFAMMVFCSHCYIVDGFFDAHIFKEGFVGVSFFFVLSGFIIAYNYQYRLQEHETDRRTFWVARIARVYPLHWLTLFVAAVPGGCAAASGCFMDWIAHFMASLTLTNAYIPKADYFFSFNSPSWSLCCEQLFYFCFPFLISLARNGKRLISAFLVVAVAVVAGMYLTPPEEIKGYWYVNPITRFPDFMVGMLLFRLYEYLKGKEITVLQGSVAEAVAVIVFAASYMYAAEIPKVYRYSCYYWLPVAMVIGSFALQRGILSRMLNNRFMVLGGETSYGFYLIHLLVLRYYVEWQKMATVKIEWYCSVPVLFVIVFLLSVLSYRYFEMPMNRRIKLLLNK